MDFQTQFQTLDKQLAFDFVCTVIFRRAEESIISGNPAPDSESALAYMVSLISEWGYNNTQHVGRLDAIRQENEFLVSFEDRDND